jgi:hypothetical protein
MAAFENGSGIASQSLAEHHMQQHAGRKRRSILGAASFPAEKIQKLHAAWQAAQQNPEVAAIAAVRNALPIAPYR